MKTIGWTKRCGLTMDGTYHPADGVLIRPESSGALIYNVNSDRVYELHADALSVFRLCNGNLSIREIAEVYTGIKGVRTGRAQVLVRILLREFVRRGLVVNTACNP